VAALFFSLQLSARTLHVASKKFTESVVLGEILTEYLRSNAYEVEHIRELGGTRLVWNSLESGQVDLYVEYSGTLKNEIFQTPTSDMNSLREQAHRKGIEIYPSLGFNDTYAIGMKKETARNLRIEKISDLRNKKLRAGFSNEFLERQDGWPGLKKTYGLDKIAARGLDHNIAYRALNEGDLALIDLYSTDPEIKKYDLKILLDDKNYFPQYYAHVVVRKALVDADPKLSRLLGELSGKISNEQMIAMNARVTLDAQSEKSVARQFLGLTEQSATRQIWQPILKFTMEHLGLVILSMLPAILLAVPMGFLAFYSPRTGAFLTTFVSVVQTIPALALLVFLIRPLTLVGLSGIGNTPAIVTLFLYSLLPIYRNTITGLEGIPLSLRNVARVMGLKSFRKIRLFDFPLALPMILTGIRTALVLNIGYATLGALVGAGGLGQPILTGIRLDNYELILSGAVPSALLALVAQFALAKAEKFIIPRGLRL
jgi:osmoprotectant transport system permease protein